MTTTEGLTAEDVAHLRRPFATEAVKWLPIGKPTQRGMSFMPHIDASLVFERLSEVDPCWTEHTEPMLLGNDQADPFGMKHMAPWRCSMTVKGVTRSNVGQLGPGWDKAPPKPDDKHIKQGHSDAIKRAAWAFGVGAYLRAIPMVTIPQTDTNGRRLYWTKGDAGKEKFGGLNPEGINVLRQQYRAIVTHSKFVEHYGEPVLYGDIEPDEVDGAHVVDASEEIETTGDGPDVHELEVLVALTKYNGRADTSEDTVRATLSQHPFPKCLARVLTSVKANLLLSAEDAETIRGIAIRASEGDDAAFEQLERELGTLADTKDDRAGDAQGSLV